MTQANIGALLIVGGGTAGWMAAAALARKLAGTGIAIRLIESEEIGTVGVGEATVPHIRDFNRTLGIDERDFMLATQATFKLAIEFVNWGGIGSSYMHPFAPFGPGAENPAFIHLWSRLRRAGRAGNLDRWSLPVMAARAGRFAHPAADPATPQGAYGYAYQFDAGLYARFLRTYAEARGVERREGRIDGVERAANGDVSAVRLADGSRIAADFCIDCSGFRGLLIEGAMQAGYESWNHWLLCDRAWAAPCANVGPIQPATRVTALEAGWAWHIPLQHRAGNGHVFASAFLAEEAARERLLSVLEAPPLQEPKLLRFLPGKRKRQWVGNVVALGLASGFLEPLESTSIHLIQVGIETLLDLFPTSQPDPLYADEFNRRMEVEYLRVRDFLILHYCAAARTDTPFWNHVRTMDLPDSLREKMALFRARCVVQPYRHGLFQEPSWQAVYAGQGVTPEGGDPLAGEADLAAISAQAEAMAADIARMAAAMPEHAAMLPA